MRQFDIDVLEPNKSPDEMWDSDICSHCGKKIPTQDDECSWCAAEKELEDDLNDEFDDVL